MNQWSGGVVGVCESVVLDWNPLLEGVRAARHDMAGKIPAVPGAAV
ncbi:MAG: hypothetical protein ACYDGN_16660 [Acidimicrobiales bacterium]